MSALLSRVLSPADSEHLASASGVSLREQTEVAARVWNAHGDESYRRDESHWRGQGRWSAERWETLGKGTLRQVELACAHLNAQEVLDGSATALEWGPGGGANLAALSTKVKELVAVDISTKNLEESGRILRELGFEAYRPIHLQEEPSSLDAVLPSDIGLFISTAVFQHFPSKPYGLEVLDVVSRHLRPGAIGYLQIRYDNGNPKYAPKDPRNYSKSHITATSYALDEFWLALKEVELEPAYICRMNPTTNYAGFVFQKRRAS